MICFDIELNGQRYCRAGIDGYGVVSVMLHWMDFDGSAVADEPDHPLSALSLNVMGHVAERAFTNEEAVEGGEPPPLRAVHWRDVKRGLKLGDELRIRIVERDPADADPPIDTPALPPLEDTVEGTERGMT